MTNTNSPIQWTNTTWSPVVGCTHVSAGCDHCYAATLHNRRYIAWKRGNFPTAPAQYHQPFKRVQLLPQRLEDPLRWRKPRRVFVNSMSDLFHEDVPDQFIDAVFAVMASAPCHTYQILTKRPERMLRWMRGVTARGPKAVHDYLKSPSMQSSKAACEAIGMEGPSPPTPELRALYDSASVLREWPTFRGCGAGLPERHWQRWPLDNVWLGVSVEDQRAAEERIPLLAETPAAVRFLSMEPLLERVDITHWLGLEAIEPEYPWEPMIFEQREPSQLDWVIVGGESGKHARDFAWEWIPLEECRAAGVPIFVKQLGSVWAHKHHAHDHHGGDMREWPAHLHVREFPQTGGDA